MFRAIAMLSAQFPPPEAAREDGLLCMGGDLRPERLLAAYSRGIFPCYERGQPVLWWSPDPRCVMPLEGFRLPARSARRLRQRPFDLTLDAAFHRVITACALPRKGSAGAWIVPEMVQAYERLHALGYAHSIEVWREGALVGGLYGVAMGRAFFGESMFHVESEASRAALAGLVSLLRLRGATLLDCQQETPHILRMGGVMLSRAHFMERLKAALEPSCGGEADGQAGALPWAPWRAPYVYAGRSGSWTARS